MVFIWSLCAPWKTTPSTAQQWKPRTLSPHQAVKRTERGWGPVSGKSTQARNLLTTGHLWIAGAIERCLCCHFERLHKHTLPREHCLRFQNVAKTYHHSGHWVLRNASPEVLTSLLIQMLLSLPNIPTDIIPVPLTGLTKPTSGKFHILLHLIHLEMLHSIKMEPNPWCQNAKEERTKRGQALPPWSKWALRGCNSCGRTGTCTFQTVIPLRILSWYQFLEKAPPCFDEWFKK